MSNLENRIWTLKNEIHETREYISSDYCVQCSKMYAKLYNLEQELAELQNERDRISKES